MNARGWPLQPPCDKLGPTLRSPKRLAAKRSVMRRSGCLSNEAPRPSRPIFAGARGSFNGCSDVALPGENGENARQLLGCALITALAFLVAPALAQGTKPNVVFILADNVGYGDLGPYGGGELRGMPTPRIDQLAREGLRLTQFLVEPRRARRL
jgi:hypothetical protein